jgi:hypothetical protein
MAHAALLPDLHPAPALPDAGPDPRRTGNRRIHGGDAAHDDRGMTFDAHTLLFASLAVICGNQSMLFALIAKAFAITEGNRRRWKER